MVFYIFAVITALALLAVVPWAHENLREGEPWYDGLGDLLGMWAFGASIPFFIFALAQFGWEGEGTAVGWDDSGRYWYADPPECHTELVALNTGQSSSISGSGSFFLGSGSMSVEGHQYQTFTYVEKSEDGGLALSEKKASESVVYEDGDGWMDCTYTRSDYNWSYATPFREPTERYRITGWEFHVPEGSVVRDFEVSP